MKFPSSSSGGISQWFLNRFYASLSFALAVAQSPQAYIDHAWPASRAYFFSVTFIAILLSKFFHLLVHIDGLTIFSICVWGTSFFLVDALLILVVCGLNREFQSPAGVNIAAALTVVFSLYTSSMVAVNIAYYVPTGMEIYWRRGKHFYRGRPSAKTVLSALATAFAVEAFIWIGAYFATPYLLRATQGFLDIWGSVWSAAIRRCRGQNPKSNAAHYEEIAMDDSDDDISESPSIAMLDASQDVSEQKSYPFFVRITVTLCTLIVLFLALIRPRNVTYSFFSESLPLAPFGGHKYQPAHVTTVNLPGDVSWLGDRTAMDKFPQFDWLQVEEESNEFPEWSPFPANRSNPTVHNNYHDDRYNPLLDPLHTPNLQNEILEPLREALHNGSVKIKHLIIIKLESTRQDSWPFRSDSYIMKLVRDNFGGQIPQGVEDRLSNLTRTAEMLTGLKTGFGNDTDRPRPYGGISATNAYTSSTYTVKSVTGTLCGLNPMACEGNLEYLHDPYQPCLPHIFEALNNQQSTTGEPDDWRSWPWYSRWVQTHYGTWDHQGYLLPHLGFTDVMTRESIDEEGAIYIPEENDEENHHGHEDKLLSMYLRDALEENEFTNNRLFITHLTHNTHTPFFRPGDYEDLIGGPQDGLNEKVNRYLNTIAYQDEWISEILDLLEDFGIADETLLVMAGDHGISLPNDGGITAFHDPHVGNFHVPLFFAHPKLPQIEINAPVLSTQILPTILDLLIESSSLNAESMNIVKDLFPLYEGQSLIRPLIPEKDGKQEWQFTTMNPGGTWAAMRSASKPYRLTFPLVADAPWRFTNIETDPFELAPDEELDVVALIDLVQRRDGAAAGQWLTEAVHVARWWVLENRRRWRYDPDTPRDS
ncbi:Alkaline phosphatase-like alpha/beta/alpha [Penicillium hispanicum]|uniref:Alkaline phosphatase-like alpha/beta/alpha n=1 Tax=Penicillium hispanicum TaxID=1080232 RepID=UPI00254201E9|nr:Alkaline phosphatase-like alpha/beta/alpha [Penicillium hispanicum]KAJ5591627.1 Alkaline phosphatase-like alpha/beta/alpha [Penicillium hispanicum]